MAPEFVDTYISGSIISARENNYDENTNEQQEMSGGGGSILLVFALLAALLTVPTAAQGQTYYKIWTTHSDSYTDRNVPEGGNTQFKIKFQARHVPHARWEEHNGNTSNCYYIPPQARYHAAGGSCYILINNSQGRIRPVIDISSVSDSVAHGWTLTKTGHPTSASSPWGHEGHTGYGIYQNEHDVTITATAAEDTCRGPQTSTFTARILNANASNAVLATKTYTLKKNDNDLIASACP